MIKELNRIKQLLRADLKEIDRLLERAKANERDLLIKRVDTILALKEIEELEAKIKRGDFSTYGQLDNYL